MPTVIYYRFIVRDGTATRYLEDDAALDGGPGVVLADSADASWQLVTYDPTFTVPDWVAGATVYQIFPDRFANGDPANDPSPDAVPGDRRRGALPVRRRVRQPGPGQGLGRAAGGVLPRLPGAGQ